MSHFKDFNNEIRKSTFWFGLFDIIFFVSPGFLFLFIFQEAVFTDLEFLKLLFLSISMSLPFFLINSYPFWRIIENNPKEKRRDDDLFFSLTAGLATSNVLFYLSLFVFFVADYKVSFIFILIIGEVIFSIFTFFDFLKNK